MSLYTQFNNIVTKLENAAWWSNNILEHKLPYTPLEYIQSSGTQYINTGIIGKASITADIDFMVVSTTNWACVLGSLNNNAGYVNGVTNGGSVTGGWIRRNNNNINFTGNTIMALNRKTNLKCLAKSMVFTNANGTKTFTAEPSSTTYNSNQNLYMFANNKQGSLDDYASIRIYYCKIYDNNTLVRDFVPVKDKNNVVCLYDKVTGEYYYNRGSGSFIAGPEII